MENVRETQDLVSEEKFFTEGTLLAIREDNAPDNKEFVIVEVLKVWENGSLQVRYFGTTDRTPTKARFSPLWADENDKSDKSLLSTILQRKGTKLLQQWWIQI